MPKENDFIKKLRGQAKKASLNAHSPYSKACVGSAVLMEDNEIYSGCNVENASYGGTVCAERVAIFKAISESSPKKIKTRKIKKIYVYTDAGWPPCGFCRQVISEFATKKTEVIIGDKGQNEKIYNFYDLLPLSFSPDHLNNIPV